MNNFEIKTVSFSNHSNGSGTGIALGIIKSQFPVSSASKHPSPYVVSIELPKSHICFEIKDSVRR